MKSATYILSFACRAKWLLLLGGLLCALSVGAQSDRRELFMTWDDFVSEYWTFYGEEQDNFDYAGVLSELDELEAINAQPFNINTVSKAELLRLPFLSDAQADSIMAYRQKKRLFLSLGELQFISNLSLSDRQRLSLFTFAGDTVETKPLIWALLREGRHDVVARLDVPLYKRSGNKTHSIEELKKYPNRVYLGNGLANTMRYRYEARDVVATGVTLQKDAGEPFAQYQNYPYDYVSAFVAVKPRALNCDFWLGDYDVRAGEGLLLGNGYSFGKLQLTDNISPVSDRVRPHTSTSESGFFRGAAVRWHKGAFSLLTFLSYNRLDGRLSGDTVTSLSTDGLHRTFGEMEKRRTLGNLTAGLRAVVRYNNGYWAATALHDAYSRTVWPSLREYNRYYLRGKSASGAGVDYACTTHKWRFRGELAVDDGAHIAVTNSVRYDARDWLNMTLQGRYFSPRYVAPHGSTLQEASRVQNETGLLAGVFWRPMSRLELTSYFDAFYFPRPTYRASVGGSKGMEWMGQAQYNLKDGTALGLRYKVKTKQQNITGYAGYLQYVTSHRVRLSVNRLFSSKIAIAGAVDGMLVRTQTGASSKGWMVSARGSYSLSDRLSVKAFAALFFTDNYSSRLYAYEPQLRYGGSFPSFAYHGLRFVGQCAWTILQNLRLECRYGLLHYFNRSQISSGTQLIDSSSQSDCAMQLLYRF